MLLGFPNRGFLGELARLAGFAPNNETSVESHGQQAVIASHGDSIYKVFATTKTHNGGKAHKNEVAVMQAIGGHEGTSIRTAALKSHFEFHAPFDIEGNTYIGFIEQSRMSGVKPNPSTSFQLADVGGAIAEFHALLKERAGQLNLEGKTLLERRLDILNEKSTKGHIVLPSLKKRLNCEVSRIAMTAALRPVHGDLHMGNLMFDGQKYAFLDLATVGMSVAEQDLTAFASDKDKLKDVFHGYAKTAHCKPDKGRVMTLHALDVAVSAEIFHRHGQAAQAKKCNDRLEMLMS